ncbi:MAG: hypothetical protein ACYDGR_05295 [Candidatus Dormibacteria bacterium]
MSRAPRHHLLYARQNWRDTRIVLVLVSLAYVGFGLYTTYGRHRGAEGTVFINSALLPLILLPLIYLWSRANYVQFGEDEVLVHYPFRQVRVPYIEIERTRTELMQKLFEGPEQRRYRSGIVRRLYRERAVCLRVREDFADTNRKRLGGRTLVEREVVLPVTETDAAMETLKLRLASRKRAVAASAVAPGVPGRSRKRKRR